MSVESPGQLAMRRDIHLGTGTVIQGPVIIGSGATLGSFCRVQGPTVIAEGSTIGDRVELDRSVLFRSAQISDFARVSPFGAWRADPSGVSRGDTFQSSSRSCDRRRARGEDDPHPPRPARSSGWRSRHSADGMRSACRKSPSLRGILEGIQVSREGLDLTLSNPTRRHVGASRVFPELPSSLGGSIQLGLGISNHRL